MFNAVSSLRQTGDTGMADSLRELAERVLGVDLLPLTRQQLIENLVFVGLQAQLRPDQRKRGVVKAALSYLKDNANHPSLD